MTMSNRKAEKIFTRREFMKGVGAAGLALGAAATFVDVNPAAAEMRGHIVIGHPNPSTGMLSDLGAVSPWADERAVAAVNRKGGIFVKELNKSLPVQVKLVDTQSDPDRAAKVATDLILNEKIDMMVVLHTPVTVNPVSKVCDKFHVPCVSMVVPLESWLSGGPYEWCYHAFWSVDSLSDLFVGMWDEYADKTTKVFGGLWPDDPDGKAWGESFTKKLVAKGYKVVDPGRFRYWIPDFTDMISRFKREKVEIMSGVLIPPDWANFWRQARQDGLLPKVATVCKAILCPGALNALPGNLPEGLTTEVWWSPNHPFRSSITGETSMELSEAWARETKNQWTMPLGYAYAGIEIALDALKRAGSLDKNKIREAVAQTDLTTIVGPIKFRKDHCCETPLVVGQWEPGGKWPWDLGICYNKQHPEIKTTSKLVFPIPG